MPSCQGLAGFDGVGTPMLPTTLQAQTYEFEARMRQDNDGL